MNSDVHKLVQNSQKKPKAHFVRPGSRNTREQSASTKEQKRNVSGQTKSDKELKDFRWS